MTLFITAVDQQGKTRTFCYHCASLEFSLEVISAIALLGDSFLSVDLVEDNQRTRLPIDAFDGESFSLPFRQLEREWTQLLGEPSHV